MKAVFETMFPGGEYRITTISLPSFLVACAAPICLVFFHTTYNHNRTKRADLLEARSNAGLTNFKQRLKVGTH